MNRPSAAVALLAGLLAAVALLPARPAAQEADDGERVQIAVLSLEAVGASEPQGAAASDRLREELLRTGRYRLITRSRMEAVLDEQAFQQATCTGTDCAVAVGKVLGVEQMVTGSLTRVAPRVWQLSASLIAVESAETLRAESVLHEGGFVGLLRNGIPTLAEKLAGRAGPQTAAVQPAPGAVSPPARPTPSPVPSGRFVQQARLPGARRDHAAAAAGGRVFVLGGNSQLAPLDVVLAYDPRADAWETLSGAIRGRGGLAACALEGLVYASGGFNALSGGFYDAHERLAADSGAIATLAPLPVPRGLHACAVVGGRVLLAGGSGPEGPLAAVHAYDPGSDAWHTLADLPTPRERAAAAVLDGRVYVTGGRVGGDAARVVEVYDPATDAWREAPPLEVPRAGHAMAALGGRLYVFGGQNDRGELSSVEVYEPQAHRWRPTGAMPEALTRLAGAVAGDTVHLLGGDDGGFAFSVSDSHYAYR